VRSYDFSDPAGVKETRFNDGGIANVPERFRNALKAALDVPGAPAQQQQQNSKPTASTQLPKGFEERLQWGKPVNGLRAALVRAPLLGRPQAGQIMDFHLVLQNVSTKPIRLVANSAAPNPRRITLKSKANGWIYSRLRAEKPTETDCNIEPREVAILPVVPNKLREEASTSLSRNLDIIFFADMEITKAPAGAWTGKIVTAEMHAAAAGRGLVPAKNDARKLFDIWNAGCRWDETIPGGLIGLLALRVKYLTSFQPGHPTTPALL
jgi:hypothetical protein